MSKLLDTLQDILTKAQDAEDVINYWKNDDAQKKSEREINRLARKTDLLISNSVIMWICMVVVTILCWVFFDKIITLFGINNKFLSFLIVSALDAIVNLIIAGLLHIFRH